MMYITVTVPEVAYRYWERLGQQFGDSLVNWFAAERLQHQVIEKAAYFRWLKRGQPFGDPWADWFDAEKEVVSGRPVDDSLLDSFEDERLQHDDIEKRAYFRWLNRGGPFGDPWAELVCFRGPSCQRRLEGDCKLALALIV